LLVVAIYGLSVVWNVMAPGLDSSIVTLSVQAIIVVPFQFLDLLFTDFSTMAVSSVIYRLLISTAVMYFTFIGYRNLQKIEWMGKRSNRL
jgi:hypothetical protein